jgi:hypothetical protein
MSMTRVSVPGAATVAIVTVQTASTGANFTAFADRPCYALDLVNNSGAAIEYRRVGTGPTIAIADGTSRLLVGIRNANEISVRRVDQSNTQVVLTAEAIG